MPSPDQCRRRIRHSRKIVTVSKLHEESLEDELLNQKTDLRFVHHQRNINDRHALDIIYSLPKFGQQNF